MMIETKQNALYNKYFIDDFSKLNLHHSIKTLEAVEYNSLLKKYSSEGEKFIFKNPLEKEPVLAIDCEMVGTTFNSMTLARVSAVNLNGDTIMDFLIKPHNDLSYVTDYRSFVTGLSSKDFTNSMSFEEAVQLFCMKISKDTIILGHAVHHDLLALKLNHQNVIDTSFLFPVKPSSFDEPSRVYTHSLSYLSEELLKEKLERNLNHGVHDSIEDSVKSLKLVLYLFELSLKNETIKPISRRIRYKKKFVANTSLSFTLDKIRSAKPSIVKPIQTPKLKHSIPKPHLSKQQKQLMKKLAATEISVKFKTRKKHTLSNLRAKQKSYWSLNSRK